jgi:hypothetical protein
LAEAAPMPLQKFKIYAGYPRMTGDGRGTACERVGREKSRKLCCKLTLENIIPSKTSNREATCQPSQDQGGGVCSRWLVPLPTKGQNLAQTHKPARSPKGLRAH